MIALPERFCGDGQRASIRFLQIGDSSVNIELSDVADD
jgi:hypothetical protein